MRRFILLLLLIPSVLLAKDEVSFPDKDHAIRNGVKYKLKHKANIYELIDRAKDIKDKK